MLCGIWTTRACAAARCCAPLQLEALDLVERAFVHVDYARRDQPEHRTERLLAGLPVVAEEPLMSPHHTGARSGSGRNMCPVDDSADLGSRGASPV